MLSGIVFHVLLPYKHIIYICSFLCIAKKSVIYKSAHDILRKTKHINIDDDFSLLMSIVGKLCKITVVKVLLLLHCYYLKKI